MSQPNPSAAWSQLLSTSQAVIQSLSLVYGTAGTALPADQVYTAKLPHDRNITLPCVQVCMGGKETCEKGDFEDTVITYPVLVVHLFAGNQDVTLNNDELYWREQILKAFLDFPDSLRAVTDVDVTAASVWDCQVDTNVVIDPSLFHDANLDVGGFLLKFSATWSRNRK